MLGALSLLLNGGGVGQLQTITRELDRTLHGREGEARSVLHRVRSFAGQLDRHRQDIVQRAPGARPAVAVARTASGRPSTPPSTSCPVRCGRSTASGTTWSGCSQALSHLSGVGVHVIRLSKASTIDTLRQLSPVLSRLQASGDDFVKGVNVALTYPFVDEVVGRDPQVARNLQMGDYTNLDITLDLSLDDQGSLPSLPTGLPTSLPTPADQPAHLRDHQDPR